MIAYNWSAALDSTELALVAELLADAAQEDADAGFTRPVPPRPEDAQDQHLLVRVTPDMRAAHDSAAPDLAGYLRLHPEPDGSHTVDYVVHPKWRSHGLTTLLVEQIGLDINAGGGWCHTGATQLAVCSAGDHPAARRLARRFRNSGIRTRRESWVLLAPTRLAGHGGESGDLRSADSARVEWAAELHSLSVPPRAIPDPSRLYVLPGLDAAVYVDPDQELSTEFGVAGAITGLCLPPGGDREVAADRLLRASLRLLASNGLRVASLVLDAADEAVIRVARALQFAHYRTDREYTVV